MAQKVLVAALPCTFCAMYALPVKRMFGGRTLCARRLQMELCYKEYYLISLCSKIPNGRFSICVKISRAIEGKSNTEQFYENDKLACILLQESEREAIRLGKNIIDKGLIRF
jgi:hypothetical protein